MQCLACGEDNRDDARFCASCGVRILARCATCDRELASGARFCDGCGAPVVDAADTSASGTGSGAQARKTLTIVFADLQGSTAMQERMDPESVRALMDRYYTAMRTAVETHGGKVVKFVGDGVMSVFGVPEVAEDDALRGLRSAVAMQEAFAPFADEYGLALRVGVNTGEVVVDVDDADVVGDAVNVAARLEGAAGPGEVLVGEETWRLTRHAAAFDAVPALTLKGRATAVTPHRLTGLDDVAAADTGAPFVGRRDELATLRALFDEVVEQRRPRLATVIGSPGVGKSRLVQELRDELGDRVLTVRGRCDEHAGAAFAPVAQLLEGLGDLNDLTAQDTEQARVLQAVDGMTGTTAGTTPEETFWAVRRVLDTAAASRPVVAVLDDVHWAEPLLFDLIEHLAEWLNQPVLLVAVARPELRELRPALTELQGRAGTLVALEGLERQATEQLVREHLGTEHVPVALFDRLAASSDGNPLFVRELVRMLVDDGVVRRDGGEAGGWTLAIDAAELEVPPTIQSLLASRLDRLRPQERVVLERAAVIGAEVYQGALTEMVPPEVRGEIDVVLESLRRKELLEPAGTYWIDERVLRFHHALIREAAYRRLLKESRARLHERVATWLVAKTGGGPDHDETIGFHLEQAQANLRSLGTLDERGQAMATEAAARLGAAARRALDRDDLLAAAGLAERAVACLNVDGRTRADILLTRCEALLGAGDVAAVAPAIDELQRLGSGSRRIEAWATCFAIQHAALTDPRSLVDPEYRLVDAAAVLDGAGDAAGAAKAHRVHASLLARLGRVGDCEAALDKALGAARAAGDRRQTTSVLGAAPLAALWGPSPVPRAGGRCLDVIRLVRITTGAPAVEATSIRCQAVLEAFRGRVDAARSLINTARSIAEDLGLRHGLLEVEQFAGIVELCGGDMASAAEHLGRAQEGFTAMGVTVDAAQAAALRARAALALGRVDDAMAYAATSEQLGGDDLKTSIAWRAVKAEVLAARGDVTEATRLAEAAVALAVPTDALVDRADALAALAVVHSAAGNAAAANRVAAEARALYEQKGASALAAGLVMGSPVQDVAASSSGQASPLIANAASRMWDEVNDLAIAGRFDEIAARYRADVTLEDRRPGMSNRVVGVLENIEHFRVIRNLGLRRVDSRAVAVRGDRLALVSSKWDLGYEVEALAVVSIDRQGLYQQALLYDPGDLVEAVEELDRLYLAGLTAEQTRVVATSVAAVRAYNRRDWATMRPLLTDDFVLADHRPGALGELAGPERFIEYARVMIDVAPDYVILLSAVLAVCDRASLGETFSTAQEAGGLSYEQPRLMLAAYAPDGRVSRLEFFALEQSDLAWARYRALASSHPGLTSELSNEASRVYERNVHAIAEGRLDELSQLMRPDAVRDDRRTGMASRQDGRAANLANFAAIGHLGITGVETRTVAVRGERLALVASRWHGDFEVSLLAVAQVDGEGQARLVVDYDATDLMAAMEQLDELYAAELSEAQAQVVRAAVATVSADARRDWPALRALLTDDFVVVDHRPASWGELVGADAFVEYGRAMVEVAPEYMIVIRSILAVSDRAALGETVSIVQEENGLSYEQPRVILGELTADGRIARFEFFAPEQVELAWTRYGEVSSSTPPGASLDVRNTASEVAREAARLIVAGNLDNALAVWSERGAYEDRRSLMQMRAAGGEGIQRFVASLLGVNASALDLDVLAVRGDRLVVVNSTWRGAYEVQSIGLFRIDGASLIDLCIFFDPSDLDAAMDEVDQRYIEQLDPGCARVFKRTMGAAAVHGARDWDDFGEYFSDDIVVADRRLAGYGEIRGLEALIEYSRVTVDETPDFRHFVRRVLAVDDGCLLAESAPIVAGPAGGQYELSRLAVTRLGPDGRIDRYDTFDLEQIDAAWARYHELRASSAPSDRYRKAFDLALAGRFDDLVANTSPGYVLIDKRRGLASRVEGPDAMVAQMRTVVELGVRTVETETVATRGDRLALIRGRYAGAQFELELLLVYGADENGLDALAVLFEPEDLLPALLELDEQYAHGEAAAYAGAVRVGAAYIRAHAERDWDVFARLHAADVVLEDHRPAGWGTVVGAERLLERNRTMVELAPDYLLILRRYLAIAERSILLEFGAVATSEAGTRYETPRLLVVTLCTPTGPLERLEYFDVEQADEAWARYRELTSGVALLETRAAGPSAADDNLAATMSRRWFPALVEGAWETVGGLLAPDYVLEDRRPMLVNRVEGREAAVEWFGETASLGVTGVDLDIVAQRGDRSVLVRRTWRAQDYEMTSVCLVEVDATGHAVFAALWNSDDFDDALLELDDRYLAGEGAEHASWMRLSLIEHGRAHWRRDWDALRQVYDDDVILVDHLAGAEQRGADAIVEYHKQMVELAPTYRQLIRRQLAIGARIVLAELLTTTNDTDTDVGRYEVSTLTVSVHDAAGRLTRLERFAIDDLDRAWACYHELGGE